MVFVPVGETKPLSQLKRKNKRKSSEINDKEEDDDEEIWMTNIIERYENRPNESIFQSMCLAEFRSEFRLLAKSQVPKTLNENVVELQNSRGYIFRNEHAQNQQ